MDAYDLTQLDASSFEHLVNMLALRILGAGHTGFGPGPDAGRDGYFEGEASYPSEVERWSGIWYLQSKFHKPHLSKDAQKWLIDRIEEELQSFENPESGRKWPDNWIVATNIDPSGKAGTGSFDKARELVANRRPQLRDNFHIWGGTKILSYLNQYPEVIDYYRHFLTPGHVLTALYDQIKDRQAEVRTILYHLVVTQFNEQQYTKLEQAGSSADSRPGIHRLFIDLPFQEPNYAVDGLVMEYLFRASSKNHRTDVRQPRSDVWRFWRRHPSRARVWFIKGGPGQGKSTIGQYFCQIQRAALILDKNDLNVSEGRLALAHEVKNAASSAGFWPTAPRIPISIELKDFAQWFGHQPKTSARGVLTYLANRISASVEQEVLVGTLKRALQSHSWFVSFDGLDEVPHDVKDAVASAVRTFIDDTVVENDADVFTVCTSRPQGYSGQFAELDGPTVNLVSLSREQSLRCAQPLLALDRSQEEATKYLQILTSAIESSSVRELMTTPLQSHIMAIVVRGGSKPPERRWQLFTNFYEVIRSREANRDLPDTRLAKLLREDEQLLKTVHNRLGFVLHSRAETSEGAQTKLSQTEFRGLVSDAVAQMMESQTQDTVDVLMNATTDRLVLVSTPDDGDHVRFDIRPLQEFFAAEFVFEYVSSESLQHRIDILAPDSHWREVMHFLLSALIEGNRTTEMSVSTSVLQKLNDGGREETWARVLARRLSRGAFLVARLLQEGVLEQDRRIRQQFRNCLEPIAGLTDIASLGVLANVHQVNSKTWLINFLVETIQELDLTENVGAAILLADVLPDDHEHVPSVQSFLRSCPPNYISHILAAKSSMNAVQRFGPLPPGVGPRPPAKNWFVSVILDRLLDHKWATLSVEGIASAVQLLKQDKDQTMHVANTRGLNHEETELLRLLLTGNEESPEIGCDYGVLKGSYFRHDWTTGLPENMVVPDIKEDERYSGILDLVSSILKFAKSADPSTLRVLIEHTDFRLIDALPPQLTAYVPTTPRGSWPKNHADLRTVPSDAFGELLSGQVVNDLTLARPISSFTRTDSSSLEQWRILLRDLPKLGYFLWAREAHLSIPYADFMQRKETITILVEALIQYPDALLERPQKWGLLLLKSDSYAPTLRKALARAAASHQPKVWRWMSDIAFTVFRLRLPEETVLLPHIVNALLPDFESILQRDVVNETREELRRDVIEMMDDVTRLENIRHDLDQSHDVRAAATLMLRLVTVDDNQCGFRSLLEFYRPGSKHWFLPALVNYLGLFCAEEDAISQFLIGNLLDRARADYYDRQILDRLLTVWRENSFAPVQTTGAEERWLRGSA